MLDLEKFGKALRELRESRGITQDDAVTRSSTYSEASGLRRIERGEQRPKRAIIMALLTKGLEEDDPDKIDGLLALAGYQGLKDAELARLGFKRKPEPEPSIQPEPPAKTVPAPPVTVHQLRAWTILSVIGAASSVFLALLQSWFVSLCCLLYASLYAISVLLEAAYDSRGVEIERAAFAAASTMLATSLAANWLDTYLIIRSQSEALWLALSVFILGAGFQWLLVSPALSSQTVVPTQFQSHPARAAHLKNSVYFLLLVVAFWLPPRHCVEALSSQPGREMLLMGTFCPRPWWLWIVFVLMLLISIPMGSRLLDNLRPEPGHNKFVTLFYTRALLYFLLSAICLIWYSAQPLP